MSELADALESLANLLEAKAKKGKRTLMVAAFSGFNKRGKPVHPVAINVGDQIYLQRQSEHGAGLLRAAGPEDSETARGNGIFSQTQAGIGRLYATALEALAAGEIAEIAAQTYEKRWVTDGEPCPICDENAIAGWIDADEEFPSGDDEPLAHPNCFIGGTSVTAGAVLAATSRHFRGEIVVVGVAGKNLSVTPNHPILTDRGWVAAGSLEVGDHLVQCGDPTGAAALIDPYHHYVETGIEQIFDAAVMSDGMLARSVPTTSVDFHGDVSPDSEVDVVSTAGSLRNDPDRDALEFSENLIFALCDRLRISLFRESAGAQVLVAANHTPNSSVGGGGDALPLLGCSPLIADSAGRLASAVLESEPTPVCNDGAARDSYPNGDRLDALARTMRLVEVVEIERRQFDGQVYNLETASGFYLAGTIIAHNCKCEMELRKSSNA